MSILKLINDLEFVILSTGERCLKKANHSIMYWIYNFSTTFQGIIIVSSFLTLSIAGLFLTRPLVKKFILQYGVHNEINSYYLASVAVLFALVLGQITVETYETYVDAKAKVAQESGCLISLFNELDGYPHPLCTDLEQELIKYIDYIVNVEWPDHQRGVVTNKGSILLERIEDKVMSFEPKTESQKALHNEVMETFDEVVRSRASRILMVNTGLPHLFWVIVIVGAMINISITYLFYYDNIRLHILQVALLSSSIGLVVFLTVALDNPFRGELSVSRDSYQTALRVGKELQARREAAVD